MKYLVSIIVTLFATAAFAQMPFGVNCLADTPMESEVCDAVVNALQKVDGIESMKNRNESFFGISIVTQEHDDIVAAGISIDFIPSHCKNLQVAAFSGVMIYGSGENEQEQVDEYIATSIRLLKEWNAVMLPNIHELCRGNQPVYTGGH